MAEAFPKPNDEELNAGLINEYIKTELKNAKIILQRSGMDLLSKTWTITTDKNVPEKTMSNITQYAKSKGFNIKFITSE